MPRTAEDVIRDQIGAAMIRIAVLTAELDAARATIAALEAALQAKPKDQP